MPNQDYLSYILVSTAAIPISTRQTHARCESDGPRSPSDSLLLPHSIITISPRHNSPSVSLSPVACATWMSPNEPTTSTPSHSGDNEHDDNHTTTDKMTSPSEPSVVPELSPNEPGDPKPQAQEPQDETPSKQPAAEDLIQLTDDTASTSISDTPLPSTKTESQGQASKDVEDTNAATEPMASSIATLKPSQPLPADTSTQFLTVESKSKTYIDPTPPTPTASGPPSRTPSSAGSRHGTSPTRSDTAYDERRYVSEGEEEGGPRSELQSIMEQFTGGGPDAEEVMSPRLEMTSPIFGGPIQHPPRKSSLEPLASSVSSLHGQDGQTRHGQPSSPVSTRSHDRFDDHGPPVPPKDDSNEKVAQRSIDETAAENPMSPSTTMHRPPPPEPEPEPAQPFDFHRFLEQLRNKKADPVARYLKSFLSEFGKRQWMVHEQVKIISDFLAFIANKMAQCEVWRDVSDAEFDNAREGMEKLVMNRLYSQTFSPAIPPPQPIPGAKPKKRGGERPMGPGRKGQHQEDVERDDILTQKINIYAWIREEHLDIPPSNDSGKRFLKLAQQGKSSSQNPHQEGRSPWQNCSKSNHTGHPGTRSSAS